MGESENNDNNADGNNSTEDRSERTAPPPMARGPGQPRARASSPAALGSAFPQMNQPFRAVSVHKNPLLPPQANLRHEHILYLN